MRRGQLQLQRPEETKSASSPIGLVVLSDQHSGLQLSV